MKKSLQAIMPAGKIWKREANQMNMLVITLVVFISAIVVFFSKEFVDFIKKIMKIRGMNLLLPLIFATYLIVFFEGGSYWVLTKIQALLLTIVAKLSLLLPNFLANLLIMMAIPFIPTLILNAWTQRKTYSNFEHDRLMILILWLFTTLLLILGYHY